MFSRIRALMVWLIYSGHHDTDVNLQYSSKTLGCMLQAEGMLAVAEERAAAREAAMAATLAAAQSQAETAARHASAAGAALEAAGARAAGLEAENAALAELAAAACPDPNPNPTLAPAPAAAPRSSAVLAEPAAGAGPRTNPNPNQARVCGAALQTTLGVASPPAHLTLKQQQPSMRLLRAREAAVAASAAEAAAASKSGYSLAGISSPGPSSPCEKRKLQPAADNVEAAVPDRNPEQSPGPDPAHSGAHHRAAAPLAKQRRHGPAQTEAMRCFTGVPRGAPSWEAACATLAKSAGGRARAAVRGEAEALLERLQARACGS